MVNQDNERKCGTLVKFNFTKRKLEQLARLQSWYNSYLG